MSFEIRSSRPQNIKKKKKKKKKKKMGKKSLGKIKYQLLQTGKVWMDLSHILRKINGARAVETLKRIYFFEKKKWTLEFLRQI